MIPVSKSTMRDRVLSVLKCALVIFCAFQITACSKHASDPFDKGVVIAGHAGSGFNYLIDPFNPLPPNSWTSIKKALDNGAEGIEVDVQLSKDGKLILYHDTKLDTQSELSGCIAELKAKEVIGSSYDLGFPYDLFHRENIIGLDDMMLNLQEEGAEPLLYFDLKPENYCSDDPAYDRFNDLMKALLQFDADYVYPKNKIFLICPYSQLLMQIDSMIPDYRRIKPGGQNVQMDLRSAIELGLDGLIFPVESIDRSEITLLKDAGMEVMLFGGKSKRTITSMISSGADVVQVNNVSKAVRIKQKLTDR